MTTMTMSNDYADVMIPILEQAGARQAILGAVPIEGHYRLRTMVDLASVWVRDGAIYVRFDNIVEGAKTFGADPHSGDWNHYLSDNPSHNEAVALACMVTATLIGKVDGRIPRSVFGYTETYLLHEWLKGGAGGRQAVRDDLAAMDARDAACMAAALARRLTKIPGPDLALDFVESLTLVLREGVS